MNSLNCLLEEEDDDDEKLLFFSFKALSHFLAFPPPNFRN